MNRLVLSGFIGLIGLLLAAATTAAAPAYTLFDEASIVQPGNDSPNAVQLVSDTSPGDGGIDFAVPAGMTLNDLTHLGTDYNVTDDDCLGGSPRFQLNIDGKNVFVYIGPAPNFTGCSSGWQSTGDLLASSDARFDLSQYGGPFYGTFAQAISMLGSHTVSGIQLVVDGGWAFADGEQTVLVDNVSINDDVYTFENKESCKDGGWQQFTSAPGPFDNQGRCVSTFARMGH